MKPVCKVCGRVCKSDGGAMGVTWRCQYLYSRQDKKEHYEIYGFWNKIKAFWRGITGNNNKPEKSWDKDH